CGFIHAVAAPLRAARPLAAGAYRQHHALPASGSDDDMLCPGRAVDKVPLSERALFAFDDEQRLAGEHEEVLLVDLPVVHRHRLARPEDDEVNTQLRKLQLTLELGIGAPTLDVSPWRVARVEHEPAFPLRDESVLGSSERRLRNHGGSLPKLPPMRNACSASSLTISIWARLSPNRSSRPRTAGKPTTTCRGNRS